MKKILLFGLIISFTVSTFPQYNPGARQISLANSDVALANDVFTLFSNPAGLSQINWREVGIYYSPAPRAIPGAGVKPDICLTKIVRCG